MWPQNQKQNHMVYCPYHFAKDCKTSTYQTKINTIQTTLLCEFFYIDGLVQDCSNSSALAMELR